MKRTLFLLLSMVMLIVACKKDNKSLATLSTNVASNITANGAQIGGSITNSGGTTITQSGVCWATHANSTVGDSIVSSGVTSGNFTVSVSNLYANMTYYARAFATNGLGTAYGNEISFTTLKGVPTVTTAPVINILPLVATSGGTVVADGGATVTARGLCYSTSPHPTISKYVTIDNGGTGAFVDSLKPLASQTVYYIRAYAINSYGTAYGNELSFTSSSANAVTDIDGNVYPYVTINGQSWMTTNLRVRHYVNGDSIINGMADNFAWYDNILSKAYVGAYTFPNGDSTLKISYGLIYNNYTINDARGVAPQGWHVATESDWETLEFFLGMAAADTGIATGTRNTTNPIGKLLISGGSSGLNLQLGGEFVINSATSTEYDDFGDDFFYWSSKAADIGRIANIARFMSNPATGSVAKSYFYDTYGYIRCVKN